MSFPQGELAGCRVFVRTLIQDTDLRYDPAEYPRLLRPLLDGHAENGSRGR